MTDTVLFLVELYDFVTRAKLRRGVQSIVVYIIQGFGFCAFLVALQMD